MTTILNVENKFTEMENITDLYIANLPMKYHLDVIVQQNIICSAQLIEDDKQLTTRTNELNAYNHN